MHKKWSYYLVLCLLLNGYSYITSACDDSGNGPSPNSIILYVVGSIVVPVAICLLNKGFIDPPFWPEWLKSDGIKSSELDYMTKKVQTGNISLKEQDLCNSLTNKLYKKIKKNEVPFTLYAWKVEKILKKCDTKGIDSRMVSVIKKYVIEDVRKNYQSELELNVKRVQAGDMSPKELEIYFSVKNKIDKNVEKNKGTYIFDTCEIESIDGVKLKQIIRESEEGYRSRINTTFTRLQAVHNYGEEWPLLNVEKYNYSSSFNKQKKLTKEQIDFCESVGIKYEGKPISEVLSIMLERGYKPPSNNEMNYPLLDKGLHQQSICPQPAA